jgi:hypothetical protein
MRSKHGVCDVSGLLLQVSSWGFEKVTVNEIEHFETSIHFSIRYHPTFRPKFITAV